jgi:hypothetical protein
LSSHQSIADSHSPKFTTRLNSDERRESDSRSSEAPITAEKRPIAENLSRPARWFPGSHGRKSANEKYGTFQRSLKKKFLFSVRPILIKLIYLRG